MMNMENESRQARRAAARRAGKQAPDLFGKQAPEFPADRFWAGVPAKNAFCSKQMFGEIMEVISAAIADDPGSEFVVSEPEYHLVLKMGVPVIEALFDASDDSWFVIIHDDVARAVGVSVR